jgi:hypothetical protein
MLKRAALTAALLAAFAACSGSTEPGVKAIIGAALIEGGSVVHERSAIVVEGSQIRAAGSQGDVPVPPGSDKFDASGLFAVARGAAGGLRAGGPADIDLLSCSPLSDAACGGRVKKRLRGGQWAAAPGPDQ